MLFLYICLILFPGSLMEEEIRSGFELHPDEFKFEFERAELMGYDSKFMKTIEINSFMYNSTHTAVNLTSEYKIDIGDDLEIITVIYKVKDNEYRLFPIRMDANNFCDAISKNYLGLSRIISGQCGNFTGCPIPKDQRTTVCNFIPDQSQLPPFIPDGSYLLEFQVLYKSAELFVVHAYAKIYRPTSITKK